jgi:hypothetical protein
MANISQKLAKLKQQFKQQLNSAHSAKKPGQATQNAQNGIWPFWASAQQVPIN